MLVASGTAIPSTAANSTVPVSISFASITQTSASSTDRCGCGTRRAIALSLPYCRGLWRGGAEYGAHIGLRVERLLSRSAQRQRYRPAEGGERCGCRDQQPRDG